MVDYCNTVKTDVRNSVPREDIARKIYLTYPTFAFSEKEDVQFLILNAISKKLEIPISSIHVAGSAKVGRSYHKNKEFSAAGSDLDIVIIDGNIFRSLMEDASKTSQGFSDVRTFTRRWDNKNSLDWFRTYLLKGMIVAKDMPNSQKKEAILTFFNELSVTYINHFKDINVAFYLSEYFFERKQVSSINNINKYIE